MPIQWLIPVIILLCSTSFAGAEMYQWVEQDGSITFKDTPPPKSAKGKKVKTYGDGDFDASPSAQPAPSMPRSSSAFELKAQASTSKKARFNGTVDIYLTEWCGYCKQAISYMRERGIPYNAYDIEKDPAAKQRHKELGGRGVPLIIIGSNKMSGFSAEAMEHYLSSSN